MDTKKKAKLDDMMETEMVTKLDDVKMNAEMATKSDYEKMDTEFDIDQFKFYRLEDTEGKESTLLQAPRHIRGAGPDPTNNFNILMADVSYSMHTSWTPVINAWNDYIANELVGTTRLFSFSDSVKHLRDGTQLDHSTDKLQGGTNITLALKRVREEVDNCKENFVQVFIVTDGGHGAGSPLPEVEINKMKAPPGKTVNVYLLGITNFFPVNYSIDIRSHLHNGKANMPSLYWAKNETDIPEQMMAIGEDLKMANTKMTLNHEGYILPGLDSIPTIHSGEWMYFPKAPEEFVDLKVTINSEERKIPNDNVTDVDINILLGYLYPQWNNVLIQQHRKKLFVPKETFNLMDSLFNATMAKLGQLPSGNEGGVKARLAKKYLKGHEIQYLTMRNKSRTVIEVEGKYENEMELADNILMSTVSGRKYDTKNLKLRGHCTDDFERDIENFSAIYKKIEADIKALPTPHPDECCRVTMSSTLLDLQDDEFELMLEEGKYELLKNFTMTGIPAYAPVRDSSQINVWTLAISHMLVMPFTILSQRAIEEKVRVEGSANSLGFIDKEVKMKADDEKSRFNIIIPLVPAAASTVLKPIVRSNLYAIMSTFCILKNPHIIDYSAHLAALACAWVRSVADHPPAKRPEYVKDRLAAVTATAELYMDRKSALTYLKGIFTAPQQALMTESKESVDEQTLKCESLVKPLFFLGLRKDKVEPRQMQVLLPMLLAEFVGRCLSNYKTSDTNAMPFTDFFAVELNDLKAKEKWLLKTSQPAVDEFMASHTNLLKEFYAPENAQKAIKKFIKDKKEALSETVTNSTSMNVNMEKVKQLRNVASCGDVRFYTFRAWAQEMGMPEEEINAAYDPSQVLVYVVNALLFRNSRDRLSREPSTRAECLDHIKKHVTTETGKVLLQEVTKKISEVTMSKWMEEYLTIHQAIVKPLTREQIIAEAQARNIKVTEETFRDMYRYNPECKLLHNACQIQDCPYYLVANRRFNQHLSVERIPGKFPHSLHLVSKAMCDKNVDKVMEEVISGSHSGTKKRAKYPISDPEPFKKIKLQLNDLLKMYQI